MGLFATLAGAVAGPLIGGLFGGGSQKQKSSIDLKGLVKDAEKAGFNPLTVLRNGGAAGYSQTTIPALSASSFIGEAVGAGFNALANFDPMADDKRELEFELVQAQLENLQADTAQRKAASFGPGIPTYTAGTRSRAVAAQLSTAIPPTQTPLEPGRNAVTAPWKTLEIDPTVPDASSWAERYGEPGEWLFGFPMTTGADLRRQVDRWFPDNTLPFYGRPAKQPLPRKKVYHKEQAPSPFYGVP